MEDAVTIYGLLDPANPAEVRYVGKTLTRNLRHRARMHCYERRNRSPKICWVEALTKQGRKPFTIVLDKCHADEWISKERFWIARFRLLSGKRLLDIADGGETGPDMTGHRHTAEVRAKIAQAGRGRKRSVESIQKWRAKRKGWRPSDATKARMSETRKLAVLAGDRSWEKGLKAATLANTGEKYSAERVERAIAPQRGKPKPHTHFYRPVICLTTGEEFPSICSATKRYNLARTAIFQVLSGAAKTAGKLRWAYKEVSIG